MSRSKPLKSIVATGLLGLAAVLGGTQVRASDDCQPSCHSVIVTRYVTREVSYTKIVTLYDHCGRPYKVARTCYKTVRVPVKTRVRVYDDEADGVAY